MSIRPGKIFNELSLLSRLVRANCQPRFVSRRRVLVHDALLHGLVDHCHDLRKHILHVLALARVERRTQLLDISPDLRAMASINDASFLTLSDALLC